jgi:hypothetical protein
MGDITPYEAWYKQKPSVSHVIIFGSDTYMHVPKQLRQKLYSKCKKCILMGYSETSKAYRLWNNQSRSIKESRDVTFDKEGLQGNKEEHDAPTTQGVVFINKPPLQAPVGAGRGAVGIFARPVGANAGAPNEQRATQGIDLTPPKDNDDPSNGSDGESAENLTSRSSSEFEVVTKPLGRTLASWEEITTEYSEFPTLQRQSDFGEDAHTEVTNDVSTPQLPAQEPPPVQNEPRLRCPPTRYADYYACMATVENMQKEPTTYEEAILSPHREQWQLAMREEFDSLIETGTWTLEDAPLNQKPVSCKWVFKLKYNNDGSV